jgi:hypothetical protein
MGDLPRMNRKIDLPSTVYIPVSITEENYFRCGFARVNGRFPTLTYYNRQYGFALWRSSEFCVDKGRSEGDELFIKGINQNAEQHQVLIIMNSIDKKTTKPFLYERPNIYHKTKLVAYSMNDNKMIS